MRMMRQRREAAIGYAMGAALEYILIPIGLGFGTAISAMVGTNWGAGQYRRARSIGWTGCATVAATFGTIGMVVALFPEMWMGLFSNDEQVVRLGTSYLQIMGPIYGFYGLGTALFFVTQGVGSNMWTMDDCKRRTAARQRCGRADCHLLAGSRSGRVLCRRRRRFLRVCSAGHRRNAQGEGARRDAAIQATELLVPVTI